MIPAAAADAIFPAASLESSLAPRWTLAALRPACAAALAACPPTPAEAQRRLGMVRPDIYARTRNRLDGAVTTLSPYITHGLLPMGQAVAELRRRHGLECDHKLIQELGWRAYFRHVWRHAGSAIFQSLHEGPLPAAAYRLDVPRDVRLGCTGVPVIDRSVRALYADGLLHNHARMWLASYLVHVRKVHWRAGADWLWAHLLDGDLASNHLSWQWVAGTASRKPYLFNAENVARYAEVPWHSAGTVLDRDYPALDELAHAPRSCGTEPGNHPSVAAPPVFGTPPCDAGFVVPDPAHVAGRDVWLVHPWSLGQPPPGMLAVMVIDTDFHARWPWSVLRWAWLLDRVANVAELRWAAPSAIWIEALRSARSVHGLADLHLESAATLPGLIEPPPVFVEPAGRCSSFSAWWSQCGGFAAHPSDRP